MKRTMTALLLVVSLLLVPTAVLAQDTGGAERSTETAASRDVQSVKDLALAEISRRMDTIARLEGIINDADHLGPAHRETLLGELGGAETGLVALKGDIEAAQSFAELRLLIPKIFEDYRIYVVVVPKVQLVIAADTIQAAVDRAGAAAGNLESTIARVGEAGFDVTEAEAALAVMRANLARAGDIAEPVPGTVLPIQPSDWPSPAERTLAAARADIRDARDALHSAVIDAHEIVRMLVDIISGV